MIEDGEPEVQRLVKSKARVRDLGEVFTPAAVVQEMLDLLPDEMWLPHPAATFLEPSCGDGNFLVAVLERKLMRVARAFTERALPAGTSEGAAQFHALEALATIYAVDISVDNVVGGTPGHEVGARDRLLTLFRAWIEARLSKRLADRSVLLRSARWIVERNVQVGNMLPATALGTPTVRETLPLLEYEWNPSAGTVSVFGTTLGAVMEAARVETTGMLSLFDSVPPRPLWTGSAVRLCGAPVVAPFCSGVPPRNGNGRRKK